MEGFSQLRKYIQQHYIQIWMVRPNDWCVCVLIITWQVHVVILGYHLKKENMNLAVLILNM